MPATEPLPEKTQLYRERVEAQLVAYCNAHANYPEVLDQAIRHSLLAPGKRLRPMLALMAAEACGSGFEAALPAACAIEMVHTYSLIHDDLPAMDDDDLRRGRPTCHRQFGEANAILAGDALLTRAFEIIAKDVKPAEISARVAGLLAQAAGGAQMVGGQVDDLAAEQRQETHSLDELEAIHRRKTGAMLQVALQTGGVIAGAEEEQLDALATYGGALGLAFQVVDDLLDHAGDEGQLGKRTGKDASRGKLTYPGLLGAEASRARAEKLVAEAQAALSGFGDRGAPLAALAQFVLDRQR